jgi:NADH-quinone oxidoreductase subunit J
MELGLVVFFVFALTAITAGAGLLLSDNPVHCVLFLVVTILAIAGLMVTLDAEFLGTLQVIVYAGAIMVLFLFVIMMLNLTPGARLPGLLGGPAGFVAGGLIAVELVMGILLALGGGRPGTPPPPATSGTVENVGALLMTRYVFPMELASVLLLVGMVGTVALSRPTRRAGGVPGPDHADLRPGTDGAGGAGEPELAGTERK